MSKKIVLTITCILLGVMLLVTTAFAGVTGNTGYEAYKQALKKSFSTHSFTTKLDVTVSDNGNVLGEVSTDIKTNNKMMSSVTALKTKAFEKVMETYVQEDKTIVKDSSSNEYMVIEHNKYDRNHYDGHYDGAYDYEDGKAGEAIIDAFVGNMKNYFSLEEKSDGSKNIGFQLTGSQIPSVVNAIASMGIKEASKNEYKNYKHHTPFDNDINFEDIGLPKLVDEVRISSVDVRANVNSEDVMESQSINITVYGIDAAGKAHEVTVNMDMSFTGHGNTTPDTIDLTGKQVKVIEPKEFKEEYQWD